MAYRFRSNTCKGLQTYQKKGNQKNTLDQNKLILFCFFLLRYLVFFENKISFSKFRKREKKKESKTKLNEGTRKNIKNFEKKKKGKKTAK